MAHASTHSPHEIKKYLKTYDTLSLYEILCGRPFSFQSLLVDLEVRELTKCITQLGQCQEAMNELGEKIMSGPQPEGALQVRPGDQELIHTWQERAFQDQLLPKYKGPYPVILFVF
jgi:hypothetical protein